MIESQDAVLVENLPEGTFQVRVRTDEQSFVMDEPTAFGGQSRGPSPFDMLCAALGACTVMTMELYAKRKGWTIEGINVRVTQKKGSPEARDAFERVIRVRSGASSAAWQRPQWALSGLGRNWPKADRPLSDRLLGEAAVRVERRRASPSRILTGDHLCQRISEARSLQP